MYELLIKIVLCYIEFCYILLLSYCMFFYLYFSIFYSTKVLYLFNLILFLKIKKVKSFIIKINSYFNIHILLNQFEFEKMIY